MYCLESLRWWDKSEIFAFTTDQIWIWVQIDRASPARNTGNSVLFLSWCAHNSPRNSPDPFLTKAALNLCSSWLSFLTIECWHLPAPALLLLRKIRTFLSMPKSTKRIHDVFARLGFVTDEKTFEVQNQLSSKKKTVWRQGTRSFQFTNESSDFPEWKTRRLKNKGINGLSLKHCFHPEIESFCFLKNLSAKVGNYIWGDNLHNVWPVCVLPAEFPPMFMKGKI